MADLQYTASLSNDEVLKALQEIATETKRTADTLDKEFNSAAGGADKSALAIGGAAGAAAELTSKVIELGAQAARSFAEIVQGGVQINQRLEDAGKVFSAVFGDPKIGDDVIKFLDETADRLNIDKDLAIQFGRSILPRTDSLENFTELLRLTDIQADATGKTVGELEFAIREALTGDFVSLKDQFDLPREQIDRIKELTPELGASGALAKVLGDEFERLGKINVTGTLTTDTKAVQAQFSELQQVLGEPVFEEFKELVADIGDVLNDREADFKQLAGVVGDVVAALVDFVGSGLVEFLQDLDTERVSELANGILELIEKLRTLTGIASEGTLGEALLADLDTAIYAIGKINEAIETAQKLFGILQGIVHQVQAEQEAIDAGASQSEARAKGQEAFNASLKETVKALEDETDRLKKSKDAQAERAAAQKEGTDVDEEAIDTKLKDLSAEKESTEAVKKNTEATRRATEAARERTAALKEAEKIREKQKELEKKLQEDLEEISEKGEMKRLDILKDAADARTKLARDSAAAVAKINRDHDRDVADATRDFNQDVQDLAKDQAKERAELEQKLADDRVKIEQDAADRLADIKRNLERDLREAERGRDAVAFLKAQEGARFASEDVVRERGERLAGLETEAEQEREALKTKQEEERAALDEAFARKLDDLQRQHEEELGDQREHFRQQLQEINENEEQKLEELKNSLEQQRQQAQEAYKQQQADLDAALAKQLASIKNFSRQAAAARRGAGRGGGDGEEEGGRQFRAVNYETFRRILDQGFGGRERLRGRGARGMQAGGGIPANESVVVGERGPELFAPSQAGQIIPNNQLAANFLPPSIANTSVNNSRNLSVSQGILDPSSITPTMIAIAREQALQIFREVNDV